MRIRRFATLSLAVVGLAAFGADAAAAPSLNPADGSYRGEYTSGNHGPGDLRLQVEDLRPGLRGVKLMKWSGELQCQGDRTESVSVRMTAGLADQTFSGTASGPDFRYRFTGQFTARDALTAKVRVKRGIGAERCDTGPITFEAHRVGR